MNPHQQNKVDINSLSPDEQRLLRLYGKVPTKRDLLQNKLKERKYFDSGDYALSKAGKASDVGVTNIGSRHPVPENIPHLTATSSGNSSSTPSSSGSIGAQNGHHFLGSINGPSGHAGYQSRSPVKEASFLHRGTSVDEDDGESGESGIAKKDASVSPPLPREGVPIRQ